MNENSSQPQESSPAEDQPQGTAHQENKDLKKDVPFSRFRQDDGVYTDSPHVPIDNILLGIIFLIGSLVLIFYNESTAIGRKDFLHNKVNTIASLPLDKVNYYNGGKIVHVVGELETKDVLQDSSFGVMANAIKLRRNVEMYQWKESCVTKEKIGEYDDYGMVKTETTCRYDKAWVGKLIFSQNFKESLSHENPSNIPFQSRTWVAKNVQVGVFKLWSQLVDRMDNYESFGVSSLSYIKLPRGFKSEVHLDNGALYLGKSPQVPQIGDMRVSYQVIRPFKVTTIIARQAADSLAPFEGEKGQVSSKLLAGSFSPQDLFYSNSFKDKNVWFIWWMRIIIFGLIFAGFYLTLNPLRIIANFNPFLRRFIGLAFGSVIFSFSFFLYFLILGVLWFPHNVDLGRILLIISLVPLISCLIIAGSKK